MKFITDIIGDEPELLTPLIAMEPLEIVDLFDRKVVLFRYEAPQGGWTHEALCSQNIPLHKLQGADAYLGNEWVGSTEV
ncbi:hypothetical protein A6767_10535 [Aeromonas veronii]|uniref:hypothetical protein n=1 Tax=Aeromonas hydrophila TaxID=644 RepID=UPI00081745B1|nr:hypothetical protein [Aeromonas hydrophila]MBW3834711.1 hypothetical protein [Aeromonas hydrophila]MBW5280375.1 hypothetical protein [Aeromonas hydrophila]OCQ42669.1 hypothetical protein A6767_10535 [Aeromonas veronii]